MHDAALPFAIASRLLSEHHGFDVRQPASRSGVAVAPRQADDGVRLLLLDRTASRTSLCSTSSLPAFPVPTTQAVLSGSKDSKDHSAPTCPALLAKPTRRRPPVLASADGLLPVLRGRAGLAQPTWRTITMKTSWGRSWHGSRMVQRGHAGHRTWRHRIENCSPAAWQRSSPIRTRFAQIHGDAIAMSASPPPSCFAPCSHTGRAGPILRVRPAVSLSAWV